MRYECTAELSAKTTPNATRPTTTTAAGSRPARERDRDRGRERREDEREQVGDASVGLARRAVGVLARMTAAPSACTIP